MSDQIPPDVEAFISEWIGSIVELELLLLLAEAPEKSWEAESVARQLYVTPKSVEAILERMTARGLLARATEGCRFAPVRSELIGTVKSLREEYSRRRLRVMEWIYAGPTEKYQSFADAFRLRKHP